MPICIADIGILPVIITPPKTRLWQPSLVIYMLGIAIVIALVIVVLVVIPFHMVTSVDISPMPTTTGTGGSAASGRVN